MRGGQAEHPTLFRAGKRGPRPSKDLHVSPSCRWQRWSARRAGAAAGEGWGRWLGRCLRWRRALCAEPLELSPPEAEVVGDELSRLRWGGNLALRPWSPYASCSVLPVVGLGSVSVQDYRLRAGPQCRILSAHCTGASCPCCSMLLTQAAALERDIALRHSLVCCGLHAIWQRCTKSCSHITEVLGRMFLTSRNGSADLHSSLSHTTSVMRALCHRLWLQVSASAAGFWPHVCPDYHSPGPQVDVVQA